MWKENLPSDCPPKEAIEIKSKVFRILKEEIPSEIDFTPYSRLYPDNERYRYLCKAFAVSFYNSFQNAKKSWSEAYQRENNLGNYIGEYEINESDGKSTYLSNTGHYSTWFYSTWNFRSFNPISIKAINDN
jgi:hypothetical protein